MEIYPTSQISSPATIFALLLFLYYLLRWAKNYRKRQPPQPAGSWPVIGHLPLLGGGQVPHLNLANLADKYGPIFMIKLGVHRALVVSKWEMAKECLADHDKVFVNRPKTIFVEHAAYDSAMFGFSPYNAYWRDIRRITAMELLSNRRLELLKHVRIAEIRAAIKAIHGKMGSNKGGVTIEMRQWFNEINLNTVVRLVAGKSLKEFFEGDAYDQCKKAIRDFFDLAGAFVVADALPFLRWLDIGGYEKAMKKTAKELDSVMQGWLDEHKRRRFSGEAKKSQDFMDVMLDVFESDKGKPSGFDADTIVKATCLAMILGGTDTTAVTLTWALSLLLNHRDSLKKIQAELDIHVGRNTQIEESDLKNLTYLQAALKETQRLYPAASLSVPRVAVTDCTVGGYHIAAGTQLFVNLYKIHRDPNVWSDPCEFQPDRFLTTHREVDVRGQNFELIPFGSGRRICPGISFAIQEMQFALANLIHEFEIETPLNEAVDMTEGFGLTNLKALPLEVILTPRLSSDIDSVPH